MISIFDEHSVLQSQWSRHTTAVRGAARKGEERGDTHAVGGSGRESSVAFSADLLVTLNVSQALYRDKGKTHVVLGSEDLERRLNDTTSESEDEVEGGLLLDV
jgi:hypothetical protein